MFVLLSVPAVNYLAARSVTDALGVTGPWWTTITALNSACVVALLAVAISLALSPRQTPAV
jgi:hypothetical protein